MDAFLKNNLLFNQQLTPAGLRVSSLKKLVGERPDGVIVCGMGGSGLPGEIIIAVQKELGLKVPVITWKDYGVPHSPLVSWLKRPLYIFVSFSGNTEETISGIASAGRRAVIAAIATGGKLEKIARAKKLPFVGFPAGDLTPRQALGRMFYAIVEILLAARLLKKRPPAFTEIRPERFRKAGDKLARYITKKLILIYTDNANKHLGYIWKIKMNETGKTNAFANVLPEMNHNEIVGFEKQKFPTVALFLRSKQENKRVAKRFGITEMLLRKRGVKTISVPIPGKSELEKTWNSAVLADWTSYFVAKFNHIDPAKTKVVDTLKQLMR